MRDVDLNCVVFLCLFVCLLTKLVVIFFLFDYLCKNITFPTSSEHNVGSSLEVK